MKKYLLALALLPALALSKEVRIFGGYEPFRAKTTLDYKNAYLIQDGAVVGAEWLPFESENKVLQLGAGLEYTFGRTSLDMLIENEKMEDKGEKTLSKYGSFTPIYLTGKINLLQTKEGYNPLYLNTRLGYSLNVGQNAKVDPVKVVDSSILSSPYVAVGIGGEYQWLYAEANYGVNYLAKDKASTILDGNLAHRVGLNVGIRFDYDNSPKMVEINTKPTPVVKLEPIAPVIVEKPIEKIEIIPEEIIVAVEEPKIDVPVIIETPAREVEKEKEIKELIGESIVYFEFDKATVTNKEYETIVRTKSLLNKFNYVDVEISGHTDSRGTDKYNLLLGEKRAKYVANELLKLGLKDTVNILDVKSEGERRPIGDNTKQGRALNRRVEIDFKGWFDGEEDITQ